MAPRHLARGFHRTETEITVGIEGLKDIASLTDPKSQTHNKNDNSNLQHF
jgi:hypothetical protein